MNVCARQVLASWLPSALGSKDLDSSSFVARLVYAFCVEGEELAAGKKRVSTMHHRVFPYIFDARFFWRTRKTMSFGVFIIRNLETMHD